VAPAIPDGMPKPITAMTSAETRPSAAAICALISNRPMAPSSTTTGTAASNVESHMLFIGS
jgi:hypothetical protein